MSERTSYLNNMPFLISAEDRSGQKRDWCWTDYTVGIVAGVAAVAAAPVVLMQLDLLVPE